jgi:bifunctional NMN adenylyltransferase/nudix hydrolase
MRTLDSAILIGSFEPLHAGHLAALSAGRAAAERALLLIGSARASRSVRHPWTFGEREETLRSSLDPADAARITIAPLRDRLYDDESWRAGVREMVSAFAPGRRVGMLASAWSGAFPEWPAILVEPVALAPAAVLRERYLAGNPLGDAVPAAARTVLDRLRAGPGFAGLEAEYRAVQAHRKAWSVAPYPVILVTVDAVVAQAGHVLLIRRGRQPGQGLWALPGGFVDPDETLLAGCLRELREETGIRVPEAELLAHMRGQQVFDAPDRSVRGRTITHAFYFELPAGAPPAVAGSDDADRAEWVPVARFLEMEEQVFEDHYHIVRRFIG